MAVVLKVPENCLYAVKRLFPNKYVHEFFQTSMSVKIKVCQLIVFLIKVIVDSENSLSTLTFVVMQSPYEV